MTDDERIVAEGDARFQRALQKTEAAVRRGREALACYERSCPARRFSLGPRIRHGQSRFLLIVEDDPAMARAIQAVATSLCGPIHVDIAHTSEDALARLFDPITGAIVDWFLETTTARQLIHALVQRGIPCCIFTADVTRIPQDVPCPIIGKGDPSVIQRWICEVIGIQERKAVGQI